MRNNLKLILPIMSLVLAFALSALGQATTGSIEGVMKDPNGAVIPGATITAKAVGSTAGGTRTATTNDEGYFIIGNVPVGNYEVTVEKSGFQTQKVVVTVTLDRAARADVALKVSGANVNVDVTAGNENITIDPTESKLQTNLTQQLVNALPKGTTFTSLLKAAPNVRPEALSGGFQVDGASGSENTWYVDGQEVTNFRTGVLNANNNLPFELVQEVQVKSTGFEAEYGGATGGVITVVTQGGNDLMHGNFGISWRPQKLQSDPHPFLNRYSSAVGGYEYFAYPRDEGLSYYPVAKVNGPVVKGKLWYSLIYAPQIFDYRENVPFYNQQAPQGRVVNSTQRFDFHQRTEEAFARLDAQPTQNLRLFGSFLWNPISQRGNTPGMGYGLTNSPLTAVNGVTMNQADVQNNFGGRQNSNSVNGNATWTPTGRLIVNFHAGRSFLNEKLGSYGIPNQTRYVCSTSSLFAPAGQTAPVKGVTSAQAGCGLGFSSIAANYQIAYDTSYRTLFDADASLVGVNFGGRHNLKWGYQYNKISNKTDQGYINTGVVTLYYGRDCIDLGYTYSGPNAIGCGYMQRFGTKGSASSANNGIFVQDSWQIGNRLTLNLGIRAESEDVPSFNPSNPGIKFGWGDKIAPRLGFAWDVTGNGKTKVFGSYGWFYDRFKYELPRGSFGGDFYRRDWFDITAARGTAFSSYTFSSILGSHPDPVAGACNYNGVPLPNYGYVLCDIDYRVPSNSGQGLSFGAVDPNMKAARQSEYTFGVEHQLAMNWIMSGRYTHKQVDHAIEDTGNLTSSGSEAYVIGNPGEGYACEVAKSFNFPCTKPQRDYDAAEFRIDKRLSHNWFFNASYTYSRLFGNYAGLASSDEAGRTSPNVDRNFDLPFEPYTFGGKPNNGRLATDRPHVFKAYGGYDFNWSRTNSTAVSFFTTAQSGTPLTTTANFLVGLAISVYGRGDLGRTPNYYSTDLNVDHKYKFGKDKRLTLQPYVNILNLFNRRSETGVNGTITSSTASASIFRSGGCPATQAANGCGNPADPNYTGFEPLNALFNGGVVQYFNAWLAANTSTTAPRQYNTYGLATGWTAPREVRFGARLYF